MRRSTFVAIIVLIIIVAAAVAGFAHKSSNNSSSYSSPSNTSSAQSSSSQSVGKIDIKNMMFTPSQITVAKGGSVTWTNNDNTTHTVIDDLSNVGGPNSSDISPGHSYTFTFSKSGSFQYHCSIHPSMRGTIVVK